jgi:hypothetical protein
MHSMTITMLANEVERERQDARRKVHARSQVLSSPTHGSTRARAATRLGRRLIDGIKLRPATGF